MCLVPDGSLDLLSKDGFKNHNGVLELNDIYGLFKWYPFTAVQYAELKPVPCLTYSDAEMSREKCATPILKQVFSASGHRMSEINFNYLFFLFILRFLLIKLLTLGT